MADDHLRQIGALLREHLLGHKPRLRVGVGVHGDGHARLDLSLSDRAHHPLDAWREALFLDGALEERRLDSRVRDALPDVLHEQFHQWLGRVEDQSGAAV